MPNEAEKPKNSAKADYNYRDPKIATAMAKLKTPEGREAAKLYYSAKKIQASVSTGNKPLPMPPPATSGAAKKVVDPLSMPPPATSGSAKKVADQVLDTASCCLSCQLVEKSLI